MKSSTIAKENTYEPSTSHTVRQVDFLRVAAKTPLHVGGRRSLLSEAERKDPLPNQSYVTEEMWKQRELELVRKYEDQINKLRAQIEDQRKMIEELRRGTSSEA